MLVMAGKPVDATIELLMEHLEEGDVIIDGGNEWCAMRSWCLCSRQLQAACVCQLEAAAAARLSCSVCRSTAARQRNEPWPTIFACRYENTERRAEKVAQKGIRYMGMGVSGGEEGARNGAAVPASEGQYHSHSHSQTGLHFCFVRCCCILCLMPCCVPRRPLNDAGRQRRGIQVHRAHRHKGGSTGERWSQRFGVELLQGHPLLTLHICSRRSGSMYCCQDPQLLLKQRHSKVAFLHLKNLKQVDDGPCVMLVGPGGAGNFVKMVHNGIEYGDMQLISEAYDVLRTVGGLTNQELAETFALWNKVGPYMTTIYWPFMATCMSKLWTRASRRSFATRCLRVCRSRIKIETARIFLFPITAGRPGQLPRRDHGADLGKAGRQGGGLPGRQDPRQDWDEGHRCMMQSCRPLLSCFF